MPNEKNKQIVKELREKIRLAKSIVLADYLGLKAQEVNKLRSEMKDKKAEVSVSKNTLLKVALREENINSPELESDLQGPTAAIFSYEDAISPIKALFDFAKTGSFLKVKSAIFEGAYTNKEKIEEISKIQSKDELIARMLYAFKSPLYGLTNTLSGIPRNFVYVLSAITRGGVKNG